MRVPLTCRVLLLLAVSSPALAAGGWSVYMPDTKVAGGPRNSRGDWLAPFLQTELACVKPVTKEDVNTIIRGRKYNFEVAGKEYDPSDLAELVAADFVLSTTYARLADGRLALQASLMHAGRGEVVAKAATESREEEVHLGARELARQLLDQFQLCELEGTVKVERTITRTKKDVRAEDAAAPGDQAGTRTVTREESESGSQRWDLAVKGHARLSATLSVSGSGNGRSANRTESKGLMCWDPEGVAHANATFGDLEETTFSWTLDTPVETKAERVRLDFDAAAKTYRLVLQAGATGRVKSKAIHRTYGACGGTEEVLSDGEDLHAGELSFTSPPLNGRRSDPVFSHEHFETSEDQTVRTVVKWDLRWAKAPKPAGE